MPQSREKKDRVGTQADPPVLTAAGNYLRVEFNRIREATNSLLTRLPAALHVSQSDVILMHEQVDDGARIQSLPYWFFLFASCGITTMGLITNSPAVIIGAMLISPLMGPIIGLGMGVAVNDLYLGTKSLLNLLASISIAIMSAAMITVLVPIHEDTSEILARTTPTVLDLFIAVLCGFVAALGSVRSGGENVLGSVAPGAAIGVALMPPLCVAGYGMGSGFRGDMMWDAFLLFLTNLFSIVLISSLFYYFIFEGHAVQHLAQRLSNRRLSREPFFHLLSKSGAWQFIDSKMTSRKRFLFPAFLLLIISYPLMSSLLLLKTKTEIRLFLSRELEAVPGLQIIRGPEYLNYGRDSVTGSILYSAEKEPGAAFQSGLLQQMKIQFPHIVPSFRLIRIAGEADLETLRRSGRPDPVVEAAARLEQTALLTGQIQTALTRRFPPDLGLILEVSLVTDARGLTLVRIEYVGPPARADTLRVVGQTLKQELEAQGYAARDVQLSRKGDRQREGGCGKANVSLEQELTPFLEPLQSNPDLFITIDLKPGLSLKTESGRAVADRLVIRESDTIPCRYRITYTYSEP